MHILSIVSTATQSTQYLFPLVDAQVIPIWFTAQIQGAQWKISLGLSLCYPEFPFKLMVHGMYKTGLAKWTPLINPRECLSNVLHDLKQSWKVFSLTYTLTNSTADSRHNIYSILIKKQSYISFEWEQQGAVQYIISCGVVQHTHDLTTWPRSYLSVTSEGLL